MRHFGVGGFTQQTQDLIRFASKVDTKGRALISSGLRKKLRLRYGSLIFVKIGTNSFTSKMDERGRFTIPVAIRKDLLFIEGKIRRCFP